MLSVNSEERHFWSLVVSLMNNTSHHTKDTPLITKKDMMKIFFDIFIKMLNAKGSIHLEIKLTKRNICLMHPMSSC